MLRASSPEVTPHTSVTIVYVDHNTIMPTEFNQDP